MVQFWGEEEARQQEQKERRSRARAQAQAIASARGEPLFPTMKNARVAIGVRVTFAHSEATAYRAFIDKLDDAGEDYGRMHDHTGMHVDIDPDAFARAFL